MFFNRGSPISLLPRNTLYPFRLVAAFLGQSFTTACLVRFIISGLICRTQIIVCWIGIALSALGRLHSNKYSQTQSFS